MSTSTWITLTKSQPLCLRFASLSCSLLMFSQNLQTLDPSASSVSASPLLSSFPSLSIWDFTVHLLSLPSHPLFYCPSVQNPNPGLIQVSNFSVPISELLNITIESHKTVQIDGTTHSWPPGPTEHSVLLRQTYLVRLFSKVVQAFSPSRISDFDISSPLLLPCVFSHKEKGSIRWGTLLSFPLLGWQIYTQPHTCFSFSFSHSAINIPHLI